MQSRVKVVARDITFMALLVAVNTALEVFFGTFLHAVHFPFKGSLLAVLNVFVYALAFARYPRWGRVSLVGVATALCKFLLIGGLQASALPAIVLEAVIADVFFSLWKLKLFAFLSVGACASLMALVMKIVNMFIFYGMPVDMALAKVMDSNSALLHVPGSAIILCLVVYRLALGALLAWPLWGILQRLLSLIGSSVKTVAKSYRHS